MAFNIWERWPWTSFQNLNLDWLMKAVKEAVTKAEEASASVGQFDDRITANENAIDQLEDDLDTISSPVRVYVNSDREAFYRGQHITGVELKAMLQTHGDLPYVEFNGEVYMLDSVSNAGDLRFSMGHTSGPMDDDLVIRHIMIPAQSYSCAYSISNIGSGGGSSGNVFAVVVRSQSGGYVADHSYSEILSQMQNGRIPVLLVVLGTNYYTSCPMTRVGSSTSGGQTVDYVEFSDTDWMVSSSNVIGSWRINSDGTVDRMAPFKHLATLDNIIQFVNDGVTTNALLKTAQTLTAAEQAQVKQNLGISGGGGSYSPYLIPVTQSGGVYSTTATGGDVFDHILDCRIEFNGVYYYPIGATTSGPFGNAYFASSDPSTSGKIENEIFAVRLNGTAVCTVTRYEKDVELLFAPPIVDTATGDPASITDGANHYPLKSLIANIDPVQSGSGDPSPTNVRPITGWTEIRITKAITGDSGYWDITLPSAAGIVYGGTLDVVNGVLTVDMAIVDMGSISYSTSGVRNDDDTGYTYYFRNTIFNIIHWSANIVSVFILFAVMNC